MCIILASQTSPLWWYVKVIDAVCTFLNFQNELHSLFVIYIYLVCFRYTCCAGYMPCSGRCGESKCPEFCLCTEVYKLLLVFLHFLHTWYLQMLPWMFFKVDDPSGPLLVVVRLGLYDTMKPWTMHDFSSSI